MKFKSSVVDFKSDENGFSAKKFNGEAVIDFEIINSKPSLVKINSECTKGDLKISIQLADRIESVTVGKNVIDLTGVKDGKYSIEITAQNTEGVSIKCNFE